MTSTEEKESSQHVEHIDNDTKQIPIATSEEENGEKESTLVDDGSMNKTKWLACVALCLSYTTAYQQNACTAAIVNHINAEIGPVGYYNWMLSAYTVAVSVAYPLSGGLSDIFGRRWFFMGGTVVSLVGTVIALAAQNVPMVIAAMALKGVGAGAQHLALAAIAEIVPNKHRGVVQAFLDVVTVPWAIFGALIGNTMVAGGGLTFRINFIVGVVLNVLTMITTYFWYFPPSGARIHNTTKWQQFLRLDWVGVFLMATGIVLTLMGLSFGGTQFPWASAGTLAPFLLGIASLVALGVWEWKGAKQPFFARELFSGKFRTFTLMLGITFIGGMSLYTAIAFWTQQCQGMFVDDPIKIGLSALPGGTGGAVGGFLGAMIIGRAKWLGIPHILVAANIIKLTADAVFTTFGPHDFQLAMGMGFLAMFGMGCSLTVLIVGVQLSCPDEHIGLATLVLGSLRAIGGSVAITIYSAILSNTMETDAGPRVGAAVIPLGIDPTILPDFIGLLAAHRADLAGQLPGVSPEALEVARETIRYSWAEAFSNMYYAAMAFSAVAIVASLCVKDVSHNMTDSVAVTLTNDRKKNVGAGEGA
ncbi:hypothetical protein MBLNU230_g2655t1 [Neophaeotheca triangularis]